MNQRKVLNQRASRRAIRTRARINKDNSLPRISVFRSNRFLYAQLIDDKKMKTIAFVSTRDIAKGKKKVDSSFMVGESLAKKAIELGIKKAVFDRGRYAYHGRVKSVAEGARKGGLVL
jgi:large subunit ribosomal protein L18